MIGFPPIPSEPRQDLLASVYETYKNLMYAVAINILKNSADAEDAVHDAIIKIAPFVEKLEQPPSQKTKGFVLTVTEHISIDRLRKKRRSPLTDDPDAAAEIHSPPPDISPVAVAIASLPGECRRLILLKYDVGLTMPELCRLLGKSPTAIYKTISRAKKKLAEELRKVDIYVD